MSKNKQKLLVAVELPWEEQESQMTSSQRVNVGAQHRGGSRRDTLAGSWPLCPSSHPCGFGFFASLPPLRNCLIRAAAGQLASSLHLLNRSPPTVIFANPGEIFNWLLRSP